MNTAAPLLAWVVLLAGCAAPPAPRPADRAPIQPVPQQHAEPAPPTPPAPTPPANAAALREIFPFVRAAADARIVEFDASVAIDASRNVFLELFACTPDTREHESLLVTRARPSHVHAALLFAGFESGAPGSWTFENERLVPHAPTGAPLHIEFVVNGVAHDPASWVLIEQTQKLLSDTPGGGFVFAGSAFLARGGREGYEADGSGTLLGLCTFGTETIAWRVMHSPESSVEAPAFLASPNVPPRNTPVLVRITAPRAP